MTKRTMVATCVLAALASTAPAAAQVTAAARGVEPVVLTGKDIPDWTRSAAAITCQPYPSGALTGERGAHNALLVEVPPDARTGVAVGQVVAFKWTGAWVEIPVQVDEMYHYCLANPSSDFGVYSGTDKELTYAWHNEAWKKTAGECLATYEPGDGPEPDPVGTLDDDDEVVFMASDAGTQAPLGTLPPPGTSNGQAVAITDPLDPASIKFVYLYLRAGGSTYTAANGYVAYARDADADEWTDECSFRDDDPQKVGTSNTGYGPNLSGTVCRTANDPGRCPSIPDFTPRSSDDRFPRDGVTVSTDSYQWRATGRWMVRDMRVAKPGQPGVYGPDLIDRWKGRAFQQSPDSTISLVGFEDEQVNWEGNAALLGERTGPVRAIREIWGADSGTNVTKQEAFYRDVITYRYHVRVHPIPPDGLYTSWDYNLGVATTYYNLIKPNGVAIDGTNDDVGSVDGAFGFPAYFDAPDPTFNVPSANLNWEQVSGANDFGSLVYIVEMKGATTVENPAVVPYYRDDSCLDDGTGDGPVQRPWPGEASDDTRVLNGYCAANGEPNGCHVCRAADDPGPCDVDCKLGETQGAHGAHGVHYFFSNDTDNAAAPETLTEIDAQQWQFAVPTAAPTNVGQQYANTVIAPLQTAIVRTIELPSLPNPAPPSAADASAVTEHNTQADIVVSGSDLDNCELTFSIVSPPQHGSLIGQIDYGCNLGLPSRDNAAVLYQPTTGFSGTDTFTFKVNDGTSDSAPASVTITVRAPLPPLCAGGPVAGCRRPLRAQASSLQVANKAPDTRDRLRWKWSYGDSPRDTFGNPATGTTNYQLCAYDANGNTIGRASAPPGPAVCMGRPCWKDTGSNISYRSRNVRVALKPGSSGRARVSVQGRGASLGLAPLPATLPVTVQLKKNEDECWEAVFSAPAKRNQADKLQDKGE